MIRIDEVLLRFWDHETLLGCDDAILYFVATACICAYGVDTLSIDPHRIVICKIIAFITLFVCFKEIASAKREKLILLQA